MLDELAQNTSWPKLWIWLISATLLTVLCWAGAVIPGDLLTGHPDEFVMESVQIRFNEFVSALPANGDYAPLSLQVLAGILMASCILPLYVLVVILRKSALS